MISSETLCLSRRNCCMRSTDQCIIHPMSVVCRYRVKSLRGLLNRQSRAVNFVWNFCNDTQKHALNWGKRWPSGFDLNVLTSGSSKELGIHSGTINATCEQYAKSRRQHQRPYQIGRAHV